jgi:hypothetical protein
VEGEDVYVDTEADAAVDVRLPRAASN